MNCHQVLTGACNEGDRTYAVGSVEGVPFTAYAAGCNIVILASTFERVQIIPGVVHDNVQISCVDCSTDTGKIAAAYRNQICIFEPTPLLSQQNPHKLDYRWVQTGTVQAECYIHTLSWNLEGTRLLTGGDALQLWQCTLQQNFDDMEEGSSIPPEGRGIHFELGGDPEGDTSADATWECIWKYNTANPVTYLAFSSDGTLFATAGSNDRLVKIWFENKHVNFPGGKSFDRSLSSAGNEFSYTFIYLAHPRAITGFSWRKTSRYMPKGSVSNMLVTSCKDNVCRLWVETILPEDGLVNLNQLDPLAMQNPKFRTHRHKHRFMQRLKHMKTCFHFRRRAAGQHGAPVPGDPIPTLPSTYSVHDFHSYGIHGTGISPGLHFHLAASINAETDIPLVPSLRTGELEREKNFTLHWLNNKEMHFTMEAEKILQEFGSRATECEMVRGAPGEPDSASISTSHHQESEVDESPKRSSSRLQTTGCSSIGKSKSLDEGGETDSVSSYPPNGISPSVHNMQQLSSASPTSSEQSMTVAQLGDALDHKIEAQLRDWHHSPDLLFAVHPVDGSFLVWTAEWLDEFHPGSFRQAQVSFSSRIPSVFPLGDAVTMSSNLTLYCSYHLHDLKQALHLDEHPITPPVCRQKLDAIPDEDEDVEEDAPEDSEKPPATQEENSENIPAEEAKKQKKKDHFLQGPSPVLSMVSKHSNGTLNQWCLTFAVNSRLSQVLSIAHSARVCGHRFRVNDITCHPVLPLLVTTSHHNVPEVSTESMPSNEIPLVRLSGPSEVDPNSGFCSELILWKVDPVGPLSKSGGVTELARISSLELSAFSNCAWIPTLLPSTTLGSISNSPSACFVASDGNSLRVYQAVIDARALLAEMSSAQRNKWKMDNLSASESTSSPERHVHYNLNDAINIVSEQSTARPGCIIQLGPISDATHDWHNTQFLHVFQEQLIMGAPSGHENAHMEGLGFTSPKLEAMVDLEAHHMFEEPFYIVVIEKHEHDSGSTFHLWRLVLSSHPSVQGEHNALYFPDSHLVQMDDAASTRSNSPDPKEKHHHHHSNFMPSPISISTTKVLSQRIPLPDDVEVLYAAPAAGHLSSASIYPACFAPYIVTTACSDGIIRFWRCRGEEVNGEIHYEWSEWKMLSSNGSSQLEVPGTLLHVSASYSGRIACAYKSGSSFTRPTSQDPDSRYVNMCVAIYECESTGGSEWMLEDTIHLKNIHLPVIKLEQGLDLSFVHDRSILATRKKHYDSLKHSLIPDEHTHADYHPNLEGLLAVPSCSTLRTLRTSIIEKGNVCPLTQKHLIQIDWVSREDGSHILTVAVSTKILMFTPVSSDIAQSNLKAMKESHSAARPVLKKASSMAVSQFTTDEIRWMKIRHINLGTMDGLPPLPMQLSWVRDGILVVGMDNEMHVYSQWKRTHKDLETAWSTEGDSSAQLRQQEDDIFLLSRSLTDHDLANLAQESSQRRLAAVGSSAQLSRVGNMDQKKKKAAAGGETSASPVVDTMVDYGLFEASRIACPVLPQYHPKQLMELLHAGKVKRVKAILAHLVRCISSGEGLQSQGTVVHPSEDETGNDRGTRSWSRSRTLSVSMATPGSQSSPLDSRGSVSMMPEELMLDYVELSSIPPLPLWTLLMADKETAQQFVQQPSRKVEHAGGYSELFDDISTIQEEELSIDDVTGSPRIGERRKSVSGDQKQHQLTFFGPREARVLTRLLTHTHLPGLSSLDQMHLLALADTVASCNTDFAERLDISAARAQMAKETLSGQPSSQSNIIESVDDCGLRFLLAVRHHTYLLRCLPFAQRAQVQYQGIDTCNLVWAFHSESEDELLATIPGTSKDTIKWATLREHGVAWWLRNNTVLKRTIERVARVAFLSKQDPLDAAIYYLAMKKKNLVCTLYKTSGDSKMHQFFQNDFSQERWRKAALKNAFALMSKQRFHHAAAFFLLGSALRDAIDVCLDKLKDIQLAMIIARLYDGDLDICPPSLKKILYEEILGCNATGGDYCSEKAHPDPFLRSMAHWMLKDYVNSLKTLLLMDIGEDHPAAPDYKKNGQNTANPSVFNFYIYLRTHPLLLRHYLSSSPSKTQVKALMLQGFKHASKMSLDAPAVPEDVITPLERRLYFTTAHAHFKAGCPALALEVLSKLPNRVSDPEESKSPLEEIPEKPKEEKTPVNENVAEKSSAMDWSEPFDWGAPSTTKNRPDSPELELKWSDDEEEEDDEPKEEAKKEEEPKNVTNLLSVKDGQKAPSSKLDIMAQQLKFIACLQILMEELSTLATGFEVDGGQLRYELYVWLEREVNALRSICNYGDAFDGMSMPGFEGEGSRSGSPVFGQSVNNPPTLHEVLLADKSDFEAKLQRAAKRKQWLKGNQTLLRTLLSYCSLMGASGGGLASVRMELILLLQELQQEKTQQQLLSPLPFPTTLPLLSASVASHKTGIADPIKHLQGLTADMLNTLAGMATPPTPGSTHFSHVFILRDLATALSACIYQSLCDSDSFVVKQQNEGLGSMDVDSYVQQSVVYHSSHLTSGSSKNRRRTSQEDSVDITTQPLKWPGVTSLRSLLAREKDEDCPRLNILLVESFFSVYCSLMVFGMATCDSHLLYRLVGQRFTEKSWGVLFGGGGKRLVRVATNSNINSGLQSNEVTEKDPSAQEGGEMGILDSLNLNRQRMKLNLKLLGQSFSSNYLPTQFGGGGPSPVVKQPIKEDRPTYREQFIPPQCSMLSLFMNKPELVEEYQDLDYDSTASVESEVDDDDYDDDESADPFTERPEKKECVEHADPNSFSWAILRLALVKAGQDFLNEFLNISGIEPQELPLSSPLAHSILAVMEHWGNCLADYLNDHPGPPPNYIPGCYPESQSTGAPIQKYKAIMESENTPFQSTHTAALPVRRLWNYLVRKELVQDIFIRYIFGKKRQPVVVDTGASESGGETQEPIKLIHKDQDSITAFCLSNNPGFLNVRVIEKHGRKLIKEVKPSLIALASPKEIQELDIAMVLEAPSWLEDECEFDILNLNTDPESLTASNYIVMGTPADKGMLNATLSPTASPGPTVMGQTGRGTTVGKGVHFPGSNNPQFVQYIMSRSKFMLKPLVKHKVDGTRRMAAHPHLPLYLSGSQDGSVRLWEWNHPNAIATPRPAGTFAKVNRIRFSQHGNKFGLADGDGKVSLWQLAVNTNSNRAYFTHQCHNKQTSDLVFVGSSSLIATAGHSSESRNVALWDSLMPQKKAQIQAWTCHEGGSSCLLFAPQHKALISCGRKGDVCIWDIRQRQLRHRFQAHPSQIKCADLHPNEECFVTGSADGDIKVWGLTIHSVFESFPGEHARSSFFKNLGHGVTHVQVDGHGRLFSCGADGSMKVRHLSHRDGIVNNYC